MFFWMVVTRNGHKLAGQVLVLPSPSSFGGCSHGGSALASLSRLLWVLPRSGCSPEGAGLGSAEHLSRPKQKMNQQGPPFWELMISSSYVLSMAGLIKHQEFLIKFRYYLGDIPNEWVTGFILEQYSKNKTSFLKNHARMSNQARCNVDQIG